MARRVAITGAAGQLGRQLVRAFHEAGDEVLPLARPDFDITRGADLERLTAWCPDVVINSAAWTDVDGCAFDPGRALHVNGEAAGSLARAAAEAGAMVVQISTNEVFDGTLDRPYTEDDEPNPINAYGASKLAGERSVADATPRHLIVRTAWLFGPGGVNFVTKIRAAAQRMHDAGQPLRVVSDETGNPTPTPWLAGTIAQLLDLDASDAARVRVYHLVAEPAVSRLEWARRVLRETDARVESMRLADYARPSVVPSRAVLSPARAIAAGIPAGDWRQLSDELSGAAGTTR